MAASSAPPDWSIQDFLPAPGAVAAALADLFKGGEITENLTITLFRAAVGLALGAACGIWIGVMMARSRALP